MIPMNQLMEGDWVFNKHHNKPIRITPYDFFLHKHDEQCGQSLILPPRPATGIDLEPIPLTQEILEKNGWSEDYNKETGVYGHHFPEDVNLALEIHNTGAYGIQWTINCYEYAVIPLAYVHELQHAIKLCGIEKEIAL